MVVLVSPRTTLSTILRPRLRPPHPSLPPPLPIHLTLSPPPFCLYLRSFVKESLEVMCGEYKMTGVLVATKDKQGIKACSIPESCKGLITQTTFLPQNEFHVRFVNFFFEVQM